MLSRFIGINCKWCARWITNIALMDLSLSKVEIKVLAIERKDSSACYIVFKPIIDFPPFLTIHNIPFHVLLIPCTSDKLSNDFPVGAFLCCNCPCAFKGTAAWIWNCQCKVVLTRSPIHKFSIHWNLNRHFHILPLQQFFLVLSYVVSWHY